MECSWIGEYLTKTTVNIVWIYSIVHPKVMDNKNQAIVFREWIKE